MNRSGRAGSLIAIAIIGVGGLGFLVYARYLIRPVAKPRGPKTSAATPSEPRTAPEWYARGNELLTQAKDYRGASEAYRHAVELAPQMGVAHYGRGCALLELGDLDGAIPELESAYSLAPEGASWKVDAQRELERAHLEKTKASPPITK
jgi:tetratricopeptide (TPR) repeat protein